MSGSSRPLARRAGQEGQGLVEFALVLPIFLLAVVGLLDVGKLVYTNSALSQAAREGARLGATEAGWIGSTAPGCKPDPSGIGPSNPGAHVCPVDASALKARVVEAVNRMAVSVGPITAVHISCDADGLEPFGQWTESSGGNGCQDGLSTPGDLISVRVEYTYQPLTPVINSLIGSVPLDGSATMNIH